MCVCIIYMYRYSFQTMSYMSCGATAMTQLLPPWQEIENAQRAQARDLPAAEASGSVPGSLGP